MMSTFPPQGGMPQHPGMSHGQPMPGGVPHPQAMGGPMQMHPGVSAPHGQQVSQAPMMGMQPGMGVPGGPSAHAMSHLAPNAGQMMHQPGMPHQGMNPQLMHLNSQQRMMWQRQQMAAARQQQMGMQQPGQPGGFNPQQLAVMQANGQMANLPPHLQQQMASAQMLHQQQAMQEAARQQQHQSNLAAQQAHQISMQHSSSHGSHGGHPTPQPGQPNQPPIRPASSLGGTTGMESRPATAATAGPQGGPQPVPQSSQPPSQPNQQPQTSGPQGSQGQPAPSQPQPNQGQNNTQQPGQGQAQNQAQNRAAGQQAMNNQQMATQAAVLRQQQQAAAAAQARGGTVLLQAFNFANKLGSFKADQQVNDIAYWQAFVQAHFTDDALYRMNLRFAGNGDTKTFEVHASGLPRFLYTQYETDIDQVQLVLDGNQEKKLSETHTVVRADRSRMLHWFRDGTQLVWNGLFQVIYNGDKIEQLTFETREHQMYLPMSKLRELCPQASPNQNRSPKMTKTQQKRNQPPPDAFDMRRLPPTQITDLGIHKRLQTHLELGETMNLMQPLISFSREHPEQSVTGALRSLVETYAANPPSMGQQHPGGVPIQGAFPPGGVQGGVVRPNMAAMQSPALSSSGLPGQPNGATPSPHQSNMAPPMAPGLSQQSHQSSNTSPNVGAGGNKRRRSTAAGIKGEEDVNGGTPVQQPKVKASPRMASGTNKRLKNS